MARFFSRKNLWLRFAAVALCVLAGFAILEAAARLTGFVVSAPSDERNQIYPEDSSKLRILTLGESTTADLFAQTAGGAWPRLLEAKLREAGVNARVYNEGRSGTSSPMIAFRLPEQLAKYHPHIVVAMIGVNDGPRVLFTGYEQAWWRRVIGDLRVVKMAYWAWDRVERIGLCEINFDEFDPNLYSGALDVAFNLAERGRPLPEIESEVIRVANTNDPKTVALILTALASKLDMNRSSGYAPSRGITYAVRAFEIFPLNNRVASVLLSHLTNNEIGRKASRRLLECGKNLPDNLVGQVSIFAEKDEALMAVLRARKLLLLDSYKVNVTRLHYREIHRLLKEAGISLVAMQYPTLPLEKLKANFVGPSGEADRSFSDIEFVSNQASFEHLLRTMRYEEVFTDRFAGSWGHTTDIGHNVIADAALTGVLNVVKVREDLKGTILVNE